MARLTVLGIDPGLRRTGFAVAEVDVSSRSIAKVREAGVIGTEATRFRTVRKTSDDLARARVQVYRLREIINKHRVDLMACEMATRTPHRLPAFSFGVMTGIVAALDRPVIEVLPYQVKEAATGDRNAPKSQIVRWALSRTAGQRVKWPTSKRKNKLGVLHRGEHVALVAEHPADALAAIQAAIVSEQFRLACAMSSGAEDRPVRSSKS